MLIGQTELAIKLNERKNYQLREFIRRCMVEHVPNLDGEIGAYITHKFERAGGKTCSIMSEDCYTAIKSRLTTKENGYSMVYPQIVNNLVSRAMNLAQELGEAVVTAELIKEC